MESQVFETLHTLALAEPVGFFFGLAALTLGLAWIARDFI